LFRVHEQAFESFHQEFKFLNKHFQFRKSTGGIEFFNRINRRRRSFFFNTKWPAVSENGRRNSKSELVDKRKEKLPRYLLSLAPDPISFDPDPNSDDSSKESAEYPRRKRTNVLTKTLKTLAGLFATSSQST
jgi:hypothetical protein